MVAGGGAAEPPVVDILYFVDRDGGRRSATPFEVDDTHVRRHRERVRRLLALSWKRFSGMFAISVFYIAAVPSAAAAIRRS